MPPVSKLPLFVLSTVGSSIITNAAKQNKQIGEAIDQLILASRPDSKGVEPENLSALENIANGTDYVGKAIVDQLLLRLADLTATPEALREASAEIKTLERLLDDAAKESKDKSNHQLHFLATHTLKGVLAARVLAEFYRQHHGIKHIHIHVIEGLQTDNGKTFKTRGLPALITKIYEQLDTAPSGTFRRIFNATGGFKAVIPYLTVIGMLQRDVELIYMYEMSPELIQLAPLPVSLDYNQFEAHSATLEWLKAQDTVDEKDLRSQLSLTSNDYLDAHPLWTLLDSTDLDKDRVYSLNGMGLIVLKELQARAKRANQDEIWLSKQAQAAYASLKPDTQRKWDAVFAQMQDRDARNARRHGKPTNGLAYFKPNASELRPLYTDSDNSVLIAELTEHEGKGSLVLNYDKLDLQTYYAKDYSEHTRWNSASRTNNAQRSAKG